MAMDDYQPLMNASPFATSPGATESLRGLANQMNQFRSQSRLGMLDTQGARGRRRSSAAPDISSPSFGGGGGGEGGDAGPSEMSRLEAYAAKMARGQSEFAVAPGTFGVEKGTFAVAPGTFAPSDYSVQRGSFAPMGSTRQAEAEIINRVLASRGMM